MRDNRVNRTVRGKIVSPSFNQGIDDGIQKSDGRIQKSDGRMKIAIIAVVIQSRVARAREGGDVNRAYSSSTAPAMRSDDVTITPPDPHVRCFPRPRLNTPASPRVPSSRPFQP